MPKLDNSGHLVHTYPMAHGTKTLTDEEIKRLAALWEMDAQFGNMHRFAARLAEVLNDTPYPKERHKQAAYKRLERLLNQRRLTNPTANAIAQAAGIEAGELSRWLSGQIDKIPSGNIVTYRHFEIIHWYDINDVKGSSTTIRTAEKVEVLKPEIVTGGSYWESMPLELKAWFKQVKGESSIVPRDQQSLWKDATPVEVERVVKSGRIYRWDTHHEPALRRGEKVWFLTRFRLKDEFASEVCRDSFHSMQEIGSFTWRIAFPPTRPAKRWWITVEYHPTLPTNSTLVAHNEPALLIDWSISNLPKGVVYFVNWEW